LRGRLGQCRLAGAGNVFDQHVAAGRERREQLADRAVLALQHAFDVLRYPVEHRARLGCGQGGYGCGRRVHVRSQSISTEKVKLLFLKVYCSCASSDI
jgi:hypothetical protein